MARKIMAFLQSCLWAMLFCFTIVTAGITIGITGAQASCDIYQRPEKKPTSFDELKRINFRDFIFNQFQKLYLNLQMYDDLSPEEDIILSLPEAMQDVFWLGSIDILNSDNSLWYYEHPISDFAPYVLRALKRHGFTKEAEIFAINMAVFGHRYDEFDENAKTIRKFPFSLTQLDFDNAVGEKGTLYTDDEKKAAFKKRSEIIFGQGKFLTDFPNRNARYHMMHQIACQSLQAQAWYHEGVSKLSEMDRVYIFASELLSNSQKLGPQENWPAETRYIASLFSFTLALSNDYLDEYFYENEMPQLQETLDALQLDDLADIAHKAAQANEEEKAYEEVNNYVPFFALINNVKTPMLRFYESIDTREVWVRVDALMLQIAREHDLIPY